MPSPKLDSFTTFHNFSQVRKDVNSFLIYTFFKTLHYYDDLLEYGGLKSDEQGKSIVCLRVYTQA